MHEDPGVQWVEETCPLVWSAFIDQQKPYTGNNLFFSCLILQNSVWTVNSPWICVSALLKIALNGYCHSSRNQILAILVRFWNTLPDPLLHFSGYIQCILYAFTWCCSAICLNFKCMCKPGTPKLSEEISKHHKLSFYGELMRWLSFELLLLF